MTLDQECLAIAQDSRQLQRFQLRILQQADRGLWAIKAASDPLLSDGRGEPYELLLGIALGLRLQVAALEVKPY